ncbi:MAG: hypothetical protein AAGH92_00600 [Planctomycetota bacterium]
MSPMLVSTSGGFTGVDWAVLIGYMAVVSVLGVKLAGKQTDMEDFFRGGNKLPWYAVSGSMIATIISAVTFIGVPAAAYAVSGNFTYLQFGIIAGVLSRLFVAFVLIPAYYEHEVYSPYDYMGQRLGGLARSVTTAMFSLMGLLAQAARVYLTAIILKLVLDDELTWLATTSGLAGLVETMSPALADADGGIEVAALIWSVTAVGIVAVAWTMLGGIATVIWTDVMLFVVFVGGGLIALGVIQAEVPGGLPAVVDQGWDAGKFKLWTLFEEGDSEFASAWGEVFARPFTLWAAVIAVTFGNIGAYGTDQLLAQRIFTCKSKGQAQLAILTSWAAEAVVALMLLVGVGLWAFYAAYPEAMSAADAAAVEANTDAIFPVFILNEVPVGLRGLIVAGIFAAAISSLTSILAALSQTSLSAVVLPMKRIDPDAPIPKERNREVLWWSRALIVVWGVLLCAMAVVIDVYVRAEQAKGNEVLFLNLALGLASYVVGALFAAFLLSWLPLKRDAYGLAFSAPLSVFAVFASRFHEPWAQTMLWWVCGIFVGLWVLFGLVLPSHAERRGVVLAKTFWLLLACGLVMVLTYFLEFGLVDPATGAIALDEAGEPAAASIAWPWYAPIGGGVAFVFGYLLANRRESASSPVEVPSNEPEPALSAAAETETDA